MCLLKFQNIEKYLIVLAKNENFRKIWSIVMLCKKMNFYKKYIILVDL